MTFRNDFGIAFAAPDRGMSDGNWKYDSRKKKWTVDVKQIEPHLRVFELRGGTKFMLNAAASQYTEETIFQMEHKMPFPPKFLCFFYTVDAPAGFSASIGGYNQNHAFMLTNAPGLGEEGLYAHVDDTYFEIRHFAETFSLGAGTTTFHGSDYLFRVRFELLNHRAFYLGDKGY